MVRAETMPALSSASVVSRCILLALAFGFPGGIAGHGLAADPALRNWPAWRGPLLTGVAPEANPPTTWSETENVKWKVSVPGKGTASPVVWENQVFLLTAIAKEKPAEAAAAAPESVAPSAAPEPGRRRGGPGGGRGPVTEEQQFTVISYDRETGKVRWQDTPKTVLPHEGHHKDHGFASASPVTDGEVLIVSFGSRGIYGYDLGGKLLWSKDLGRMTTRNGFGEGSSPALSGNTVVIVWDHDGPDDFVVALDKRTGRELWRQAREEDTNWTTPVIVEHEGKKQVVVNASNTVVSYDLETGAPIWTSTGQTKNVIPAPVPGHGRVYVMSGFRGATLQAITLGRTGDLFGTKSIAWSYARSTPYVPSPLLYGNWLYFYANNNAQLSILDARDGQPQVDAERLEGMFGVYASPVGAADRVYLVGRDGNAWVIKNGPKVEVLAKNKLDDGFDASPAVAGREIFLRGRQSLYALSEAGKSAVTSGKAE